MERREPVALERALRQTGFAWSLQLVGEDQADHLVALIKDLRRDFNPDGDGKRIRSGYSYWGAEPTFAWERAVSDALYPVMRQSIRHFPTRWESVRRVLGTDRFHYVSLGPGTAEKDRSILLHLVDTQGPSVRYFPIDLSTEMLRLGSNNLVSSKRLADVEFLPVQLDFSSAESLHRVRELLDIILDAETPRLVSILGNTIANFENDVEVLDDVRLELLRKQDHLLIETASTPSTSEHLVQAAADEYSSSTRFREFVSSAFLHRTDIAFSDESVKFAAQLERISSRGVGDPTSEVPLDRGIRIKVFYKNETERAIPLMLGDRATINFRPDDTVRLYLSRKYTAAGLEDLLDNAGLVTEYRQGWTFRGSLFGLDLTLARVGDSPPNKIWILDVGDTQLSSEVGPVERLSA